MDGGWYFAYGANMASRCLRRRRVAHGPGEAARLDDYALAFAMPGLPLVEPAFATVRPEPGSVVHGVLYRMDGPALARLDRFETEQERFEVRVDGARSGAVQATTYRGLRFVEGRRPSHRYLRLVLGGAREHDLPEAWIRHLEDRPTTWIPVLSELVGATIGLGEIVDRILGVSERVNDAQFGKPDGQRAVVERPDDP